MIDRRARSVLVLLQRILLAVLPFSAVDCGGNTVRGVIGRPYRERVSTMKTEGAGKKSYEAPRLIEHGTVEDLTEVDGCVGFSQVCDNE